MRLAPVAPVPAHRLTFIRLLLCLAVVSAWPEKANGFCGYLFRKIAHRIGFTPEGDRTVLLEASAKWKVLERLIPETNRISPVAMDLLVLHLNEASPQRIRTLIDAAPRDPFWERRARAELFHLESLASIGGINHVRWVERFVALQVLYGKIGAESPTSPKSLETLKAQAADPNPEVALNAVMAAGGVAFSVSPTAPSVDIQLVLKAPEEARQILMKGLEHASFAVRAAARRGLVSLNYREGGPIVPYTEAQREDVTAPIRDIKRQERLAFEARTIPAVSEPDGLLLARHEMNRLPTEQLRDFLLSRRDASSAAPSLAENRTLDELVEFLDPSHIAEIRLGAVRGLAGRYEYMVGDRTLVGILKRIVKTDPNENVQLAAIEVLEAHPHGAPALRSLYSQLDLNRRLTTRLEEALEENAKLASLPSDAAVLEAMKSGSSEMSPESVDFSHRSIATVRAALATGNGAWQRQAIRGLRGRKDLESLDLLAQVMGFPARLPGESLADVYFSSDVRGEALIAANPRNHPIVDRMFEHASSPKESPRINRLAARLTDQIARSTDQRGLLQFRTVSKKLKMSSDRLVEMRGREHMSPEEKRIDDHATLLDVAHNTYALPSLNRFMKEDGPPNETREQRVERISRKMVEERKQFLEGVALGYEVDADVGDATTSGLKLYYLKPHDNDPTKPSILSVAGTEKWLDWYSNFTWGVTKRETAAYKKFLGKVVTDLIAGRKVQITGHSLGGGMAQYLAYDAVRSVKASLKGDPQGEAKLGKILENLEVVTWNAFGVTQVLRKDSQTYDPDLLALLSGRMVHYRTPFDLVSRLGEPIGPTATMPFTGWWGVTATHATSNVAFSGITLGGLENAEPTKKWLNFKPVSNTVVKWLEPVGRALHERHLKKNLEEHFDILLAAREKWLRESVDDSETPDGWLNAEIHELLSAAAKYDPEATKRLGARWEELKSAKPAPRRGTVTRERTIESFSRLPEAPSPQSL